MPHLRLALKEVTRAVNEADKALAVIDVDASGIELTRKKVEALRDELDGNVDRDAFSITQDAADAAVVGLSIVLAQLDKVRQAQTKLLIQPRDTEGRIEAMQQLVDHLRDTKAFQEMSGGAR